MHSLQVTFNIMKQLTVTVEVLLETNESYMTAEDMVKDFIAWCKIKNGQGVKCSETSITFEVNSIK